MDFKERKTLLDYYLWLSCAFSNLEKSILFVEFDMLSENLQTEVIEYLKEEVIGLRNLIS